jgi:hypothetical protein
MDVSARLTLETDATTSTRARHMDAKTPVRAWSASGTGGWDRAIGGSSLVGW